MNNPNTVNELRIAFFNDGYRIAESELSGGITISSILEMQNRIYEYMDNFLTEFNRMCLRQELTVDCKAGCSWCCFQAVMILPQEALYITNHVPPNLCEEILNNSVTKDNTIQGLKIPELLHYKKSCPLLLNNLCSNYTLRPLACRIYLSSDVNSCKHEFENPADESKFPQLYDIPLSAGRMINEGASAYLSEKGLDVREWTFESMVRIFLENEVNVLQWLKGKKLPLPKLSEEEKKYLKKYR